MTISLLRVFSTAIKALGKITAVGEISSSDNDIRARSSFFGGGTVFARSFELGDVGVISWLDSSGTGTPLAKIVPNANPADYLEWTAYGPSTAYHGGIQLSITTGCLTFSGTGSSTTVPLWAVSNTVNAVDAKFYAYLAKGSTLSRYELDGTIIWTQNSGQFAVAIPFVTSEKFSATSTMVESEIASPAAYGASQNNLALTARHNRISASVPGVNITGIAAGVSGQKMTIWNIGTAQSITFAHQSASSTAANRIFCPSSGSYVIGPNSAVDLWYDITSAGWRILSK